MAYVTGDTSALVWRQNTNQVVEQDPYQAMYRRLVQWGSGRPFIGSVTYSGTGNGTIDDLDAGVAGTIGETWTITFSDATNFAVSGSVSGAQSAGTTGTNYTTTGDPITSLLSFTIAVGGTAFVNTDAWTIPTTTSVVSPTSDRWVLDRWSPFSISQAGSGGGTDTYAIYNDQTTIGTTGALIWHGEGSGTDAIYAGIALSETASSQIWSWALMGYTGFSPTANWLAQSGVNDFDVFEAHNVLDETYWFTLNSRRYVCVWDSGPAMHSIYQGFILPYGSPGEYPYPMAVVAASNSSFAYNNPGTKHHGIYRAQSSNAQLRLPGGTWATWATNGAVEPWPMIDTDVLGFCRRIWENAEAAINGDHFLFPICYVKSGINGSIPLDTEAYGVPEGCFMVTGTTQSAQTIISISGQDYLVVSNFADSQPLSFWALRLS